MAHGDDKTHIRTRYGKFWPLDPRPKDIDVRDVAYSLAGQYRYAGYSRLTVAQHCVVGSYFVDPENRSEGTVPRIFLFHDASEGLGLLDVPSPVKHSPQFSRYRISEERLMKCVAKRFNFTWPPPQIVLDVDKAMYVTESEILFGRVPKTGERRVLLNSDQSRLWSPEEAEKRFLARYAELTGEMVGTSPECEKCFDEEGSYACVRPAHRRGGKVPVISPDLTAALAQPSAAKSAAALTERPTHQRPANCFTHGEYERENGVSSSTAKRAIRKLHEAGKVVPVRFKIEQGNGAWVTVGGWQLVVGTEEKGSA